MSNLSLMTNYPNGFANGLSVRGMPLLQSQPGSVYWVGNSSTARTGCVGGSNSNPGTFTKPWSTLDFAVSQCQAGSGDIIYILPGHAETISSASILALDVAGVAIVGLGSGSTRPTFTFTTANTANIPVTAANISIQNCLFVANFLAVASVFTATGTSTPTDFCIQNCEFRDTSAILNFLSIMSGNATANSIDGFSFVGNTVSSLSVTAATTAIKVSAAVDRMTIKGNYGNWAILADTAAMLAAGANSITNFNFSYNILSRPNTTSTVGNMISTSGTAWTGQCAYNAIWNLDNSAGVWIDTGTKLGFNQNFSPITGAADKSGLINPAAV